MSFSRKYRLVKKQDFQSVFNKSLKITRRYLLALYCKNQLPHPRLGIIVGKQHVKTAVARNKIRRIIRESFRHQKELLKGLDIIVIIRSECTPLSNQTIRDDIDHLWHLLATTSVSS